MWAVVLLMAGHQDRAGAPRRWSEDGCQPLGHQDSSFGLRLGSWTNTKPSAQSADLPLLLFPGRHSSQPSLTSLLEEGEEERELFVPGCWTARDAELPSACRRSPRWLSVSLWAPPPAPSGLLPSCAGVEWPRRAASVCGLASRASDGGMHRWSSGAQVPLQ